MPGEILGGVLVLIFAAACGECRTAEYATFEEVLADNAMERGWIPPFLPRSASEIELQNDLDTNEFGIRFRLPPSEVEGFVSDLEENGFAPGSGRSEPSPVCGPWKRDHHHEEEGSMAFFGRHVMGPAGRPSIWMRGDTVDVVVEASTGFAHYWRR